MKGLLIVWLVSVLSVSSSTVKFLDNDTLDLIEYAYNKAVEHDISPEKFVKLIECESQWNKRAKGDFSNEEKVFKANGILQFWYGTFDKFSKKYYLDGTYNDAQDQIDLAVKMLQEKDGWRHWFWCAKQAGLDKTRTTPIRVVSIPETPRKEVPRKKYENVD